MLQVLHLEWVGTSRSNNIRHTSRICFISSNRVHREWDIHRISIMIKASCNINNNSSSSNISLISNSSNRSSNHLMGSHSMHNHNTITFSINRNINNNNFSRSQ